MTDESFSREKRWCNFKSSLSLPLNFLRGRRERMRRMFQVHDGGRKILSGASLLPRIPLRRQASCDRVGFPQRYRLDRRKFAFFINDSTTHTERKREDESLGITRLEFHGCTPESLELKWLFFFFSLFFFRKILSVSNALRILSFPHI